MAQIFLKNNGAGSSPITSHSDLTNLLSNDHPQYALSGDLSSHTARTDIHFLKTDIEFSDIQNTGHTHNPTDILSGGAINGQVLVWRDSSSSWSAETLSLGGVSVHADLTGLEADDHPHYLTEDRLTGTTHDVLSAITMTAETYQATHIDFNTSHVVDDVIEGRMCWNADDGTLNLGMPGGNVTLQMGQEHLVRVRNNSGVEIPNGAVVYNTGSQGGKPTVELASANSGATPTQYGVATETISHNSFGYVTLVGLVRGIDASGGAVGETWIEGDSLYLSADPASAGTLTNVAPPAPNHVAWIGVVTNVDTNNGSIYAKPFMPLTISNLSDVNGTTPDSTNKFLVWQPEGYWDADQIYFSGITNTGHTHDHNTELTGLQGGNGTDEFYHLSESEYNNLSGITYASSEPTGFINTNNDSTFSWDDVTRTLTITPTGATFDVMVDGVLFQKTEENVQISDIEGLHHIVYSANGSLVSLGTGATVDDFIKDNAYVANVYWDSHNSRAVGIGDERHGAEMDSVTHAYLHRTEGSRYISGFSPFGINADDITVDDQSAVVGVEAGVFLDEDIQHNQPQVGTGATIPVIYLTGNTMDWRMNDPRIHPVMTGAVDGRVVYNQNVAGLWQTVEATNGKFVLYHLFATNGIQYPIISIMGQNQYDKIIDARAGANVEIGSLVTDGLPLAEFVPVATIIFETSNVYTNASKARIRSTDEGYDYVDWRTAKITPAGGSNDHGSLGGLSDDDHLQYHNDTRAEIWLTGSVHNVITATTSVVDTIIVKNGTLNANITYSPLDYLVIDQDIEINGSLFSDVTADLYNHTTNSSIHFTEASIDIANITSGHTHPWSELSSTAHTHTESEISDFGDYAERTYFENHTGDPSIHFTVESLNLDQYTTDTEFDAHTGDPSIHFTMGEIEFSGISNTGHTHDHGSLGGLGDDDHLQYHNDTRAEAWLTGTTHDEFEAGSITANTITATTYLGVDFSMVENRNHGDLAGLGVDDHTQYFNADRLTGTTHNVLSATTIVSDYGKFGLDLNWSATPFDIFDVTSNVDITGIHGTSANSCMICGTLNTTANASSLSIGSISCAEYNVNLSDSGSFAKVDTYAIKSTIDTNSSWSMSNSPYSFEIINPAAGTSFTNGFMLVNSQNGSTGGINVALQTRAKTNSSSTAIGYKGYAWTDANGGEGALIGVQGMVARNSAKNSAYQVALDGIFLQSTLTPFNKVMGLRSQYNVLCYDGNMYVSSGTSVISPDAISGGVSHFSTLTDKGCMWVNNKLEVKNEAFFDGNETHSFTSVTTTYTAGTRTHIIADASGGSFTVYLPAATSCPGRVYTIKKLGSGNTVTIDGGGTNIDGSATKSITTSYGFRTLISNGTQWYIVGGNSL